MDELEQLIQDAMTKFKNKIDEDENLKDELSDITRTLNIEVVDKEGYSFILDKGEVKDFKTGKIEEADVVITATEDDLVALFKGELKPMKAWATKRLKFKASLTDLMKLKKFF